MQYEIQAQQAMNLLTALMMVSLLIYITYRALGSVSVKGTLLVITPMSALILAGLYMCMTLPGRFGAMRGAFAFYMVLSAVLFSVMMKDIAGNSAGKTHTAVFAVYVLALLFVTLLMRDGKTAGDAGREIMMNPFIPFTDFAESKGPGHLMHFLMNIILFLPFGFLGCAASEDGEYRPVLFLSAGLLTSVLIESIQLFFVLGQCDASDILANTAGAFLGALVAIPLGKVWRNNVSGGRP